MEFCEKCGSLMVTEKKRKHTFLICKKCGWKKKSKGGMAITETIIPEKREVVVMKKSEEELPKTKIICPKCGYDEAYWYMQQTRGGDEPPTIFYTCVKCGYSWRSYG